MTRDRTYEREGSEKSRAGIIPRRENKLETLRGTIAPQHFRFALGVRYLFYSDNETYVGVAYFACASARVLRRCKLSNRTPPNPNDDVHLTPRTFFRNLLGRCSSGLVFVKKGELGAQSAGHAVILHSATHRVRPLHNLVPMFV